MYSKLIGIIIIMSQLSFNAYGGCNYKILDSEAESWVTKTWQRVPYNEQDIKGSLVFFDPSAESKDDYNKYLQIEDFNRLNETIANNVKDQRLVDFAGMCRKIYEENLSKDKISVFMLLQWVNDKYSSIMKKASSLRSTEEQKKQDTSVPSNKLLDIFLNADKKISVL